MARLWERTHYNLANNNCKVKSNATTSIKILIQCSCVSEDTKWVLPLLRFVAIWCTAILNTFFFNLSSDFLTNIDWLPQSHGSIGRFHWFITRHIHWERYRSFTWLPGTKTMRKLCLSTKFPHQEIRRNNAIFPSVIIMLCFTERKKW